MVSKSLWPLARVLKVLLALASDFMMTVVLIRKSKREFLSNNKVAKNRVLQEPNTLLTVISKSRNAPRQGIFSSTSEFSTS